MNKSETFQVRPTSLIAIALTVPLVFAIISMARAAQPPYLDEMPSPERVTSEISGKDDLDSAARRAGAFSQLRNMLIVMAGDRYFRNQLTPDEARLASSYPKSEQQILQRALGSFENTEEARRLGMKSPRALWHGQYAHYSTDKSFEKELLARFFSAAWQTTFLATRTRQEQQLAVFTRQRDREAAGLSSKEVHGGGILALLGINATQFLLYAVGLPLILLALWLAREIRPFGLDSSDPSKLRAGWSHYSLNRITGMVLSPTKSHVVTTYSSGGNSYVRGGVVYQEPFSTSTSETIHDQFFVRDTSGREQDFKLRDFDIALREGHLLSAVWGIKKGKKIGYSFLFRNHSTQRADYINGPLRDMLKPNKWLVVPLMVTVPICAIWVLEFTNYAGSMDFGAQIGWLIGFFVMTLLAFFFARERVVNLRIRRVKRQIFEKLLPILDKRAADQITTSSGATLTPT